MLTMGICGCLSNACDKIEEPYITMSDEQPVTVEFPALDPNAVSRKILLEEYTGHRCSNCPKGHAKIEELHNIFGDTLIAVGIHATPLAAPSPGEGYTYDFRTETGNTLADEYHINFIPRGIVNRGMEENGLPVSRWESKIKDADRTPVAAIQMIDQFNMADDNMLKINVRVTVLRGGISPMSLSLFMVEDSIVQPQLNGDERIDDYVHNHVLRGGLNGDYGVPLSGSGTWKDESVWTYGYRVDFNGKDWNPDHCSVVAILLDKETHEVLQVEKVPVRQ